MRILCKIQIKALFGGSHYLFLTEFSWFSRCKIELMSSFVLQILIASLSFTLNFT